MTKKQFSLMLAVALAGGFIGGIISCQLFKGTPVLAQKEIPFYETLQVKKLQIVAKDGKVVGSLGFIDEYEGNPMYGLELLNPLSKKGKKQISIFVWKEGPELYFFDEQERVRAFLALGIDGCPNLELAGKAPGSVIHISLDKWDRGSILLSGEKSQITIIDKLTDYSKQRVIWKAP